MELILEEEKHFMRICMKFGAVADIYMTQNKDEILVACNVTQLDHNLHKMHINSCLFPNNVLVGLIFKYLFLMIKALVSKHDIIQCNNMIIDNLSKAL